jgi:UDP:flavonoid glycosyltransferase YjiC (YdhE family)
MQVVNKGVGESIPAERMTSASLISGVTKVLCDPGYRRRASHISDSIRTSPGINEAVDIITAFGKGEAATAGSA